MSSADMEEGKSHASFLAPRALTGSGSPVPSNSAKKTLPAT